jgi:hypothetical protein
MPCFKFNNDKILLGADVKHLYERRGKQYVGIGGGIEPLEVFLQKHGVEIALKLHRKMEEGLESMHSVCMKSLKAHKASKAMEQLFTSILTEHKQETFLALVQSYKAKFDRQQKRKTTKAILTSKKV